MDRYKIVITELAEQDLEEIGDYIACELQNSSAAAKMIRGLRLKIGGLKVNPERHELDDDPVLAELGVRRCYYNHYKIYYLAEPSGRTVVVLRILHMLVDSRARLYRVFGI